MSLLESWGNRWGGSACSRRGFKAILVDLRRGTLDLDWWCLERERLGLSNLTGILYVVALAVLSSRLRVDIVGVAWWWAPAARARGHWPKSGGVRCRLGAELSQVQIGASLVTLSHRLPELPLGPESVEDDSVNDDAESFNDNFNNAADEGPVLKAANKTIRDVVFE